MFRRMKVKKSNEMLKVEEDIWHIIVGGVRDGSKAIDEGLKLSMENWEKAGLLSIEYGNSVLKEYVDWKLVDKKSNKYRVFSRASELANMRTLPVGTDGQLVDYLADVDWLEKLIDQEQVQEEDTDTGPGITNDVAAKKSDSRKANKRVIESDNDEEITKRKKKKKTKHIGSRATSNRKTRRTKNDYSPESKSFLFELEQLELEDHIEVSRNLDLSKVAEN